MAKHKIPVSYHGGEYTVPNNRDYKDYRGYLYRFQCLRNLFLFLQCDGYDRLCTSCNRCMPFGYHYL